MVLKLAGFQTALLLEKLIPNSAIEMEIDSAGPQEVPVTRDVQRRSNGNQPASIKDCETIARSDRGQDFLGNQNDCRVQLSNDSDELLDHTRIQACKGFIQPNNVRLHGEYGCESNSSLFPVREIVSGPRLIPFQSH